jgi:hypothetical protein
MGRVTFPTLTARLRERFVLTYCNAFPGYAGSELRRGNTDLAPQFAAWWSSGTADSNVATVIATPDGEVLHLLRGFFRAADLDAEIDFALEVAEAADAAGRDPDARRAAIVAKHRERLDALRQAHGSPTAAIDTTQPPAPDAFDPDRYPHLLMAMHQDVIQGVSDAALLPTVAGTWDRGDSPEAFQRRNARGDGLAVAARWSRRPRRP